ncbi:helix-turn-helix domain-containing protein [Microbacterium galbinum]|uniref:GAF domain-containing protein n=1 Tax=Microbacterium galbinum TaxID=2851646 RepID=A0ABY4IRK7_9MICO|nr:GAF domain-containing protein [Microbacterium galbinum]UPL13918.1 GAF domain-containing protein [Microbacterium galbinum]
MVENTASALVREVVAAARAEPGERMLALTQLLTEADAAASDVEEILAAVQESQQQTARLRRRTVELEALFSTARELVRLQDVTDVLRRLVQRAHELMGTDVTYLSEVDNAQGDLRVRYSAGTVTPEFRDLLVPAGYGLASLVADSREPVWVREYTRMADAPHDPSIDDAVAREGLVSFLGVPLAVGDEVLGALFACNRFAHDFTPDQVLLLSAFADHAAAVLHSARVLAESAAARARAEEAYGELERHLAATQIVGGIHEELTAAVVSGATLIDLVATVSDRLGRRVRAVDETGLPLDTGADARAGLPRRRPLTDAIRESRASGHAVAVVDGERRWLVVAILGVDRVLGAMVADDEDAVPDDVARPTLERAAQVAALVSFKRDAVSAIRAERRARVLGAVLDGSAEASALSAEVARPLVGAAAIDVRGREGALTVAADAVGDHGLVTVREHGLVVAWTASVDGPGPGPGAGAGAGGAGLVAATERVRRILAEKLDDPSVTAVVGATVDGVPALRASVERAVRDLRFLGPLGVSGATVRSDDFAPYHVLSSGEPEAAARFVDGMLGPVRAWDERRGTALVDTLVAYFDAGESRQGAATALRVHTNTVQQRLDRIWTLLDGDPADAEYRFRLQAAVRLERLRRELLGG